MTMTLVLRRRRAQLNRHRKYLEWNREQWQLHGKAILGLMERIEELEAYRKIVPELVEPEVKP